MSTERCIGIVFCISYLLGFVVLSKNLHFISSCSAQLFLKKTAPCTQERCKKSAARAVSTGPRLWLALFRENTLFTVAAVSGSHIRRMTA